MADCSSKSDARAANAACADPWLQGEAAAKVTMVGWPGVPEETALRAITGI